MSSVREDSKKISANVAQDQLSKCYYGDESGLSESLHNQVLCSLS